MKLWQFPIDSDAIVIRFADDYCKWVSGRSKRVGGQNMSPLQSRRLLSVGLRLQQHIAVGDIVENEQPASGTVEAQALPNEVVDARHAKQQAKVAVRLADSVTAKRWHPKVRAVRLPLPRQVGKLERNLPYADAS